MSPTKAYPAPTKHNYNDDYFKKKLKRANSTYIGNLQDTGVYYSQNKPKIKDAPYEDGLTEIQTQTSDKKESRRTNSARHFNYKNLTFYQEFKDAKKIDPSI